MSNFKFPLYARIARSENEAVLLIVGRVVDQDTGAREYVVIDHDGVRDIGDAETLEAEFIIVEEK